MSIKAAKRNIVLIGMPSSGKSTVGPLLAKDLNMGFLDTDFVIKATQKKSLKDIINDYGLEEFLEIQESTVLELNIQNYVIATGGSIVYNTAAMKHLKDSGKIIFLHLPLTEIIKRLKPGRRFARNSEQSLFDIYSERLPLYKKYADIIISCSGKDVKEIVGEIRVKI
jgi:shikimate kinase